MIWYTTWGSADGFVDATSVIFNHFASTAETFTATLTTGSGSSTGTMTGTSQDTRAEYLNSTFQQSGASQWKSIYEQTDGNTYSSTYYSDYSVTSSGASFGETQPTTGIPSTSYVTGSSSSFTTTNPLETILEQTTNTTYTTVTNSTGGTASTNPIYPEWEITRTASTTTAIPTPTTSERSVWNASDTGSTGTFSTLDSSYLGVTTTATSFTTATTTTRNATATFVTLTKITRSKGDYLADTVFVDDGISDAWYWTAQLSSDSTVGYLDQVWLKIDADTTLKATDYLNEYDFQWLVLTNASTLPPDSSTTSFGSAYTTFTDTRSTSTSVTGSDSTSLTSLTTHPTIEISGVNQHYFSSGLPASATTFLSTDSNSYGPGITTTTSHDTITVWTHYFHSSVSYSLFSTTSSSFNETYTTTSVDNRLVVDGTMETETLTLTQLGKTYSVSTTVSSSSESSPTVVLLTSYESSTADAARTVDVTWRDSEMGGETHYNGAFLGSTFNAQTPLVFSAVAAEGLLALGTAGEASATVYRNMEVAYSSDQNIVIAAPILLAQRDGVSMFVTRSDAFTASAYFTTETTSSVGGTQATTTRNATATLRFLHPWQADTAIPSSTDTNFTGDTVIFGVTVPNTTATTPSTSTFLMTMDLFHAVAGSGMTGEEIRTVEGADGDRDNYQVFETQAVSPPGEQLAPPINFAGGEGRIAGQADTVKMWGGYVLRSEFDMSGNLIATQSYNISDAPTTFGASSNRLEALQVHSLYVASGEATAGSSILDTPRYYNLELPQTTVFPLFP